MIIKGTIEVDDKEVLKLVMRIFEELQFRNRVSNK